jgi:hypothetical protein
MSSLDFFLSLQTRSLACKKLLHKFEQQQKPNAQAAIPNMGWYNEIKEHLRAFSVTVLLDNQSGTSNLPHQNAVGELDV